MGPRFRGDAERKRGQKMTDPIKFILDGVEVEAAPGETIWQVASRLGTEIPHLCWLPKPGYRADGNCRACMVEVEGEGALAASCIRKPTAGMKVKTASDRPKRARNWASPIACCVFRRAARMRKTSSRICWKASRKSAKPANRESQSPQPRANLVRDGFSFVAA